MLIRRVNLEFPVKRLVFGLDRMLCRPPTQVGKEFLLEDLQMPAAGLAVVKAVELDYLPIKDFNQIPAPARLAHQPPGRYIAEPKPHILIKAGQQILALKVFLIAAPNDRRIPYVIIRKAAFGRVQQFPEAR